MTRRALQHELQVVSRCRRRSTSSFGHVIASGFRLTADLREHHRGSMDHATHRTPRKGVASRRRGWQPRVASAVRMGMLHDTGYVGAPPGQTRVSRARHVSLAPGVSAERWPLLAVLLGARKGLTESLCHGPNSSLEVTQH